MKSHELAQLLLNMPNMDISIPFGNSDMDITQAVDGYAIGVCQGEKKITLKGVRDKKERKLLFYDRPMTGNNPFF